VVFKTRGIDYSEVGFAFRNLVYGLEALQKKQSLGEFQSNAFWQIRFMLEDEESANTEPYTKYKKLLREKKISSFEFNSRLVKVLMEKDLNHFESEELESALRIFKDLANYYILKMQGVNVG